MENEIIDEGTQPYIDLEEGEVVSEENDEKKPIKRKWQEENKELSVITAPPQFVTVASRQNLPQSTLDLLHRTFFEEETQVIFRKMG